MSDELVLHGAGLDQPIPINRARLEREFAEVDKVAEVAIETGDPWPALAAGRELLAAVQLKGISLARLLYRLQQVWERFGLEDTFEDIIVAEWGLSKHTIYKYTRIYRVIFENPEVPPEVIPKLAERPINTLNRLVRPVNERCIQEPEQWYQLAEAEDDSTVAQLIKQWAGESTRGRPRAVFLLYPDGMLAYAENDRIAPIGLLKTAQADLEDDLVARGVDIVRRALGVRPV